MAHIESPRIAYIAGLVLGTIIGGFSMHAFQLDARQLQTASAVQVRTVVCDAGTLDATEWDATLGKWAEASDDCYLDTFLGAPARVIFLD